MAQSGGSASGTRDAVVSFEYTLSGAINMPVMTPDFTSNGTKDNSATFIDVRPTGVIVKATNPAETALILIISCHISRTYKNQIV